MEKRHNISLDLVIHEGLRTSTYHQFGDWTIEIEDALARVAVNSTSQMNKSNSITYFIALVLHIFEFQGHCRKSFHELGPSAAQMVGTQFVEIESARTGKASALR